MAIISSTPVERKGREAKTPVFSIYVFDPPTLPIRLLVDVRMVFKYSRHFAVVREQIFHVLEFVSCMCVSSNPLFVAHWILYLWQENLYLLKFGCVCRMYLSWHIV